MSGNYFVEIREGREHVVYNRSAKKTPEFDSFSQKAYSIRQLHIQGTVGQCLGGNLGCPDIVVGNENPHCL